MIPWIVAGVGVVCTASGAVLDPRAAAFAWTAAFGWGVTLVLGALVLELLQPVAPIRWLAGLLPPLRALAGNTALLVPLFLPTALAVPLLYGWAHPAELPPSARHLVEARGAWQSPAFFLARSVAYLAVWLAVSRLARSGRVWHAVLGLVAVGLTWTLASFDWWMSLEPASTSSVYGLYSFAGGVSAALAALIVLVWRSEGPLLPPLPRDVYHALGRLLFAFVALWAYLFWAQFLVVWIGGVPDEARPLAVRLEGWPASLVVLLAAHFAAPFVLLLGRAPKRSPAFLSAVAALVLVAHAFDQAWLVLPALWPADPLLAPAHPPLRLVPLLVGPFLAVAGILAIGTRARLGPVSGELLSSTLSYRSP